ncbi:M1 family metallopeptidase [Streptomyces sp. NPDC051776]|uniref:M1 family metallopeptidase n=1 Tax=Streptomyces sp. NPDC051776 TaxID=3155414 RepID=UPI00342B1953
MTRLPFRAGDGRRARRRARAIEERRTPSRRTRFRGTPSRGGRRTCAAVAAVLLPVLVAGTACSSGGDDGGGTGAQNAADPLFPRLGNGGYDVGHYALRLDYDVESRRLDGTAVVTAEATQDLRGFSLDLSGLKVRKVTVDGRKAEVRRERNKLVVRPAREIGKGATFRTAVDYHGRPRTLTDPDGSTEGWVPTDDGAFVVGEPAGAMTWFPVNNHPSDKATYDVRITVPRGWTAVSNGELHDERTRAGRTTFVWRSAEPMASYLATATIGKFEVDRSRTKSGLPLYVAVDPREAAKSRKPLATIPDVLEWETKVFGPYPFSSSGALVEHKPKGVDYALEIQTKPAYPEAPDRSTVVHEMAHEWFGNSVTPKTWRDMWLNEGFATYAEWLWHEQHGGDSAQKTFDALYAKDADEGLWAFPPGDPGKAENISGDPVYERAAMALHQLRLTVGERDFFRLLKEWTSAYRHRNADAADFIAFCEKLTGRDLGGLFRTWIYEDGRPKKAR